MYPGATASREIRIRIPTVVIRIPTARTAIRPIVPIAASQQPPKALAPFFCERITLHGSGRNREPRDSNSQTNGRHSQSDSANRNSSQSSKGRQPAA